MKGRGSDPKRARELMAQDSEAWAAFRPEILGSLGVGHPGGAYTMALYFTSEAAAREGETKEMPENLKAQMEEMATPDDRRARVLRPEGSLDARTGLTLLGTFSSEMRSGHASRCRPRTVTLCHFT